MSDLFAPPKAPVELPREVPPRPAQVKHALYLLGASLALGALSFIPGFRDGYWEEFEELASVMVLVLVISYIAYGAMMYWLSQGNNLIRWILLALNALSLLTQIFDFEAQLAQGILAYLTDWLILLLELTALTLLFRGEGAAWFKAVQS